ncbi:hypothetical protein WA026_003517 [Henosepilachna vigintioctopunctata]|uniref:Triosephosphate isomerase n=1 Tax=Henosepilachna vigintioctopunctata TaxID=420089 RepID=A0AAW1TJ51_9CUCU
MATKSCAAGCRPNNQKLEVTYPIVKKFIVTLNWKMNGNKRIVGDLIEMLRSGSITPGNEVIVAVPAPYLDYFQQQKPNNIDVAGQNIYKEPKGAFTGEISANMLLDIGAKWVILGAAERRLYFDEDYKLIGQKAQYALGSGLKVVLCVGDAPGHRELNEHINVIHSQLEKVLNYVNKSLWKNIVIAYDPIWAINSKRTLTPDEAQEIAETLRNWVSKNIDYDTSIDIRIQYGGPVSIKNVKQFAAKKDIDGLYIGGLSLKPDFMAIINANNIS